jgi:hypothetical protein
VSEAVTIALISAVGLILSGVLVELVRARKRQDSVVHEMKPNHGGSLRDAVNRLGDKHDALDTKLDGVVERLIRLETRTEYIVPMQRHGGDDRVR